MRDILGRPHLRKLAVSSGFCKRKSKMSAETFFDLLFNTVASTEQGSLSHMVSYLESEHKVKMKKQSLDERFTENSVSFVKAVLKEMLNERFSNLFSKELLPEFSRIRIKDSTKFFVPENLSENYQSCGKGPTNASMSIQYEYDLKSGSIIDLNITSGNRNDRTDASETFQNIQADDLIIRDLGYYSLSVFEQWHKNNVFFLSRLDSGTIIYDAQGKKICFKDIYRDMQESGIKEREMQVFAGEKARLPVRLIIQTVPEEVYEKRIREKTKKSKGQGRGQITEETRIRCRFSLFITNAESSVLPAKYISLLYRIRWQIELQYKTWKSVFKIDKLHKMKEERYLTLLYTKLLQIILSLQITYSLQQSMVQSEANKIRVLSIDKSMKTLKTLYDKIYVMFRGTWQKAKKTALYIQERLLENHWLESKNKKLCFPEILELLFCLSDK